MHNDVSPKDFLRPSRDSVGWLLWEVCHLWKRELENGLEKFGLTSFQWLLLRNLQALSQEKEIVTQIDLAQFSHSNVMMTSKVLRSLLAKNYIVRTSHPTDTRAKVISITSQGVEVAEKAVNYIQTLHRGFFGDDDKIQELKHSLKHILKQNEIE